MIQPYKVPLELLLLPHAAPAARSSLHGNAKIDGPGLWRVPSTGRTSKEEGKDVIIQLLIGLRSKTGLLVCWNQYHTSQWTYHIGNWFPINAGWHGSGAGSPNRLSHSLHECKHVDTHARHVSCSMKMAVAQEMSLSTLLTCLGHKIFQFYINLQWSK